MNIKTILTDALLFSVPIAALAGVCAWTADRGAFNHSTPTSEIIVTTLPPCAEEDAALTGEGPIPCLFDATLGNGEGTSFRVNADLTVTYLGYRPPVELSM